MVIYILTQIYIKLQFISCIILHDLYYDPFSKNAEEAHEL